MIKHNQDGSAGIVVSLVLTIVLLIGAIGFGAWAYSNMQDYKENSDQKVAVAEQAAIQKESKSKDAQFEEVSKSPLKIYKSPDAYGSLVISYPKTWSGYVSDSGGGTQPLDGYFSPGVVPDKDNQNSIFAFRVQVVSQTYANVVNELSGQQKAGKVKVAAYALPKVPKVVGVQATGEVSSDKTQTLVILPLRSQTLKIWTEGTQYVGDFNKYILANFSFSP